MAEAMTSYERLNPLPPCFSRTMLIIGGRGYGTQAFEAAVEGSFSELRGN